MSFAACSGVIRCTWRVYSEWARTGVTADIDAQSGEQLAITDAATTSAEMHRAGPRQSATDGVVEDAAIIEPAKQEHSGKSGKMRMVARDGIEPSTRGFSVRCSTN